MSKKKLGLLIGLLFVLSSIIGCGKKVSPEAQEVIDLINSIGEVDFDDEILIGECEDAYIALSTEQQAEVTNTEKLAKAREKLDKLLATRPIPYTNANWDFSRDEIIDLEGKSPDEEYDTDYYHVLQYNNRSYEGFDGLIRYSLVDGKLVKVLFVMERYSQNAFDHYDEIFTTKYGKPGFENEAGRVWYQSNANIGLTGWDLFGGSVVVTYTKPGNDVEE